MEKNNMKIKQSVINTFTRVGIDYQELATYLDKDALVYNRFSGASCYTYPLIASLIAWVYNTSNEYELGIMNVQIADFDRIRYFIMEQDNNAYMTCID